MSAVCVVVLFFFFKQKTAYEMRISDWSSDVCSSDLRLQLLDEETLGRPDGCLETTQECLVRSLCAPPGTSCRRTARRRSRMPRPRPGNGRRQIGRASCRERVCQYV